MKKIFAAVLALTLLFSFTVFAEGDIKIKVNGKELVSDVPPEIVEGRTFVPMRAVFEALGANVTWHGEQQLIMATEGSKIMVLKIGSASLNVCDVATGESKDITLDVAPFINNGRTLVPVRAVSEALGASVSWDGEARKVTIVK